MKKNIFALLALVSFSVLSYAQQDMPAQDTTAAPAADTIQPQAEQRLSLGLRGAAVIPYGGTEQYSHSVGGEGIFDLQYSMYWHKNTTNLGFLFGASLSYQQAGLNEEVYANAFTATTDGGNVNYSVSSVNIKETRQRLDVEVPLMFALVADNGVFFNVGPRFSFPVWTKSQLQLPGADISAYFPVEGVTVPNERITGKVDVTSVEALWNAPLMTIKLGFDLGYEFRFQNLDALDLGIYCDWTGLNIYRKKDCTDMVQVVPPSATAPAEIIYNSPSDAIADKLGGVNVGLKLAYHFHLEKE